MAEIYVDSISVDEICVDSISVDEMNVDKMSVDEMTCLDVVNYYQTKCKKCI